MLSNVKYFNNLMDLFDNYCDPAHKTKNFISFHDIAKYTYIVFEQLTYLPKKGKHIALELTESPERAFRYTLFYEKVVVEYQLTTNRIRPLLDEACPI